VVPAAATEQTQAFGFLTKPHDPIREKQFPAFPKML
jgi:hypothetical protein